MKPRLRTIAAVTAPLAMVGAVVAVTQSADASPGPQPRIMLANNMLPDLAQTEIVSEAKYLSDFPHGHLFLGHEISSTPSGGTSVPGCPASPLR